MYIKTHSTKNQKKIFIYLKLAFCFGFATFGAVEVILNSTNDIIKNKNKRLYTAIVFSTILFGMQFKIEMSI